MSTPIWTGNLVKNGPNLFLHDGDISKGIRINPACISTRCPVLPLLPQQVEVYLQPGYMAVKLLEGDLPPILELKDATHHVFNLPGEKGCLTCTRNLCRTLPKQEVIVI